MSSDATERPPASAKVNRRKIRFFNVTLKNGIVVSTPASEEKQILVADLIRTLETSNPDFAWVQFIFVRTNYSAGLVRLKNAIHSAKIAIEQPSVDLISEQLHERKELHRDYYRRADARMKKIDEVATKPTITMAIQGMWIGPQDPRQTIALPFEHCIDEHDGLALFQYSDPRILLELVDRRMVEDISAYLYSYTRSRVEPPSFLLTPEELPSYVHLPAGSRIASLSSLSWGTFAKGLVRGNVAGEGEIISRDDIDTTLVRLTKVPKIEKSLEERDVEPLAHLASSMPRSFELIYNGGTTDLLLSARTVDDLRTYVDLLDSVYGQLKCKRVDAVPSLLRRLPAMVGLKS
jgi:hypothetical protein